MDGSAIFLPDRSQNLKSTMMLKSFAVLAGILLSTLQVNAFTVSPASRSTTSLSAMKSRRSVLLSSAAILLGSQLFPVSQAQAIPPGFKRIRTQFIAALGDPNANSGNEAESWGLWPVDPGPRGVFLKDYTKVLAKNNNVAPAGWKFDPNDWWVEEHGLIMEAPDFPMSPGEYLVTGGRSVTTTLTVSGNGGWKLADGKLYDVTHLPCRSARYSPNEGGGSPLTANQGDFPVTPGAEMPKVPGCNKLDYAVLFVIGVKEAATEL